MKNTQSTPIPADLTPAQWQERLQAAETALARLKADRGTAAEQLNWLTGLKERTENQIEQRRLYFERRQDPSAATAEFWEINTEAILGARLKQITDGGAAKPSTVSGEMRGEDGVMRWVTVARDVELPSLEALTERLGGLEAQVTAGEAGLRQLKLDARAALQSDWEAKNQRLADLRAEHRVLQIDVQACRDVDQALQLRAKLDTVPLGLIQAEMVAIQSQLALTGLGDPATEAEIATRRARITELEAELKGINAALLKARLALSDDLQRGNEGAMDAAKLGVRLTELEDQWRNLTLPRDMRAAASAVPWTRSISGHD